MVKAVGRYRSRINPTWQKKTELKQADSKQISFCDLKLIMYVMHVRSGQQVTEAVTVQVGHAETLLPLLTLLGFSKDNDTLTSTNYATQAKRSFRTSHTLPYAANLLLVLYDCGGGDLRLQPLLNEKPVTFPGLTDQRASIPLYQDVRGHYSDLLKGCDFETECQLFKHPAEV